MKVWLWFGWTVGMSLAFIEFEARILGLSLETKIFLIRKEERKKGQSHI